MITKLIKFFSVVLAGIIMSGCSMSSFVETIGMPVYFEGRSCDCDIIASRKEINMAVKEALCSLGCEMIAEEEQPDTIIGERKFYVGFFCGQGGETLSVNIQKTNGFNRVTVISYKRSPYLAAPRFLHKRFRTQFKYFLTENKKVSGGNQ